MNKPSPNIDALLALVAEFNRSPLTRKNFKLKEGLLSFEYIPSDSRGFPVGLEMREGVYELYCDSWHDEFEIEGLAAIEVATSIFEQLITLLNGQTTLRVSRAGRMPYKWELMHEFKPGQYESLGLTALLVFNYFGK